jgi:hypothetical protein
VPRMEAGGKRPAGSSSSGDRSAASEGRRVSEGADQEGAAGRKRGRERV